MVAGAFDEAPEIDVRRGAVARAGRLGEGGCRLVFTNLVPDRATARAVAPGWREGLDRLGTLLEKAQ